jgi:hypothetical protein
MDPQHDSEALPLLPKCSDLLYASCFCEENIYHLAKLLLENDPQSTIYVVIISNPDGRVPLWHNKTRISPENPDGLVIWDYHVILVHRPLPGCLYNVYDFDSDVPWPCSLAEYAQQVLGIDELLPPSLQRLYRLISGLAYVRDFSSDRSHMLAEDGISYRMPVPAWPCIGHGTSSLPALFQMETSRIGNGDIDRMEGLLLDHSRMLHMLSSAS